jgi:hypothetical protein
VGFAGLPPGIGWVPWTEGAPSATGYERAITADNALLGYPGAIHDGCISVGPVGEPRLSFETDRIVTLIQSMRRQGFVRSNGWDGDVRADILIDEDGSWRWWTTDGHHRAAVAAALDLGTIPVRIRGIAYRSEVRVWPKVLDCSMSTSGALAFFDLFRDDDRWPPCYNEWRGWVGR